MTLPRWQAPSEPQQEENRMNYRINAMHCDGCARAVTAAVRSADPDARLTLDVAARRATIATERTEAVLAALAEADFPATAA